MGARHHVELRTTQEGLHERASTARASARLRPQPLVEDLRGLQRAAGNRAVTDLMHAGLAGRSLIRRKLAGPLRAGDPRLRLEYLLSGKKVDGTSFFDWIVKQERQYTFAEIVKEYKDKFGEELPQNLAGYQRSGSRQIVLYRADGRPPGKIKKAGGFGTRTVTPFELLKATMLKDVNLFVEDHVRQNRQDLKSYATDVQAGGFASADRYLYKIDLGVWTEFTRPPRPRGLPSAVILANSNNLVDATRIAIDTKKATNEIFLLFELGYKDITDVKAPGGQMTAIDWDQVTADK